MQQRAASSMQNTPFHNPSSKRAVTNEQQPISLVHIPIFAHSNLNGSKLLHQPFLNSQPHKQLATIHPTTLDYHLLFPHCPSYPDLYSALPKPIWPELTMHPYTTSPFHLGLQNQGMVCRWSWSFCETGRVANVMGCWICEKSSFGRDERGQRTDMLEWIWVS